VLKALKAVTARRESQRPHLFDVLFNLAYPPPGYTDAEHEELVAGLTTDAHGRSNAAGVPYQSEREFYDNLVSLMTTEDTPASPSPAPKTKRP
jgi:hypothetical protein